MDFGLTSDQKDIQRTGPRAARRACQARPGPRARGGRKDRRRAVARDRAARLARGRSGRGGDMASALRGAAGVPGVIPGVVAADVIVVIDDGAARIVEGASEPVATIDPTRPAARVTDAVGEELTRDVQAALDRASVAVAAELVGVCDRALAMTVAYVKEREQVGTPVGVFQAVSHRAAEMCSRPRRRAQQPPSHPGPPTPSPSGLAEAASIAKTAASVAGPEVTAGAIRLHGGVGFTWRPTCTRSTSAHTSTRNCSATPSSIAPGSPSSSPSAPPRRRRERAGSFPRRRKGHDRHRPAVTHPGPTSRRDWPRPVPTS